MIVQFYVLRMSAKKLSLRRHAMHRRRGFILREGRELGLRRYNSYVTGYLKHRAGHYATMCVRGEGERERGGRMCVGCGKQR